MNSVTLSNVGEEERRSTLSIFNLPSALLLLLLLAASLLTVMAAAESPHYRNDDTYITLTYAKSLMAGEGWRYNGGPETLGTTTPLFAILVATVAWVLRAVAIETVAVTVSTLSWLGTAWLFLLAHRDFGLTRVEGILVAISALLQGWWLYNSLGMEATLLLFGLTVVVWLTARGHAFATGFVSALLFLIRPEGVAMVPVAGLWLWWQGRGQLREVAPRFVAGAVLPLVVWALYAVPKFGNLLPNSATAKIGQGVGWPGDLFIERLWREWLLAYVRGFGFSPVLSLVWPLALAGLIGAWRQARPLLPFAAWLAFYLAAYTILQAPGYWWYAIPVFYVLQLFVMLGAALLLRCKVRGVRVGAVLLALLLLGVSFQRGTHALQAMEDDPRAESYLALVEWLHDNTTPESNVAFIEIGYLGYFSDRYIVDLAGLTQPEFTHNATRLDLARNFWQAEPDYLIYNAAFDWLLGDIVRDVRFRELYRPVVELQSHLETPMIVYERRR